MQTPEDQFLGDSAPEPNPSAPAEGQTPETTPAGTPPAVDPAASAQPDTPVDGQAGGDAGHGSDPDPEREAAAVDGAPDAPVVDPDEDPQTAGGVEGHGSDPDPEREATAAAGGDPDAPVAESTDDPDMSVNLADRAQVTEHPDTVQYAPETESPEQPAPQPGVVAAHAPSRTETPESPASAPYRPDGTVEPNVVEPGPETASEDEDENAGEEAQAQKEAVDYAAQQRAAEERASGGGEFLA